MKISQAQKDWYARGEAAMAIVLTGVALGHIVVDAEGRVWATTFRGKKCEPFRMESPVGEYLKVYYVFEGVQYKVQAHRLVWIVLRGEIPLGFQINHIDGVGTNNHPDNLEVVDNSGNEQHARKVLDKSTKPPRKAGEEHGMVKLTWEKVREMRRLHEKERLFVSDLVRRFQISPSQATRILKYQSWIEPAS